ncbi:MAG: HAMP domain-containing sensor histidine kinase [Bacteroidota bacterium]
MKHRIGTFRNSIILKLSVLIFSIAFATVSLLFVFATFILTDTTSMQSHKGLFGGLIVIIVIIFFIALIVMHNYLKPIIELSDGVNEIRNGNLENKISVRSKDEFGELATGFNEMTTAIKQMIQAKEQLLYDVSHELKTPLTNSKLALEILPESNEKRSVIEDIGEMELMINELLESARLNSSVFELELSKVKVKDLVSKTIFRSFKEVERISVSPISPALTISIDETRILTVIKNLLDNSLKYSSEKSPIEINVIDRGDQIVLQIDDSGSGIPEEKLPFIFEPFYRTDNSRAKTSGGYGLGLHLCKKIMDIHEASLTIQNKPNNTGILAQMTFNKDLNE